MQKKIKVALMSYSMDNRKGKGTALYTRRLIENLLADERFEFYLVHFDVVDDPLYKKAREIIMPRIRLPFATRFARTMLFFWKYRNEKFDIIHWFQPRLYPFFWLAPARHIVVTAHGAGDITAPGTFPPSRRIFNFIMRHFNDRISAIIGVSEFGRTEIIEYYRANPARTHVIYNGGGEEFKLLDKISSQRYLAEQYLIVSPFILDISRLEPSKNIPHLIEVYTEARARGLLNHSLVIVGFRGSDATRVFEYARRSIFEKDIQFVNFVEEKDLNTFYAAADLFVFPSLNEGFGLPVIEAFAAGVPVITSASTSLPEIANNAALLVDPTDTQALVRAIGRVLSDNGLRSNLINRGLSRASDFTWKKCARSTLLLYEKILADPREQITISEIGHINPHHIHRHSLCLGKYAVSFRYILK